MGYILGAYDEYGVCFLRSSYGASDVFLYKAAVVNCLARPYFHKQLWTFFFFVEQKRRIGS